MKTGSFSQSQILGILKASGRKKESEREKSLGLVTKESGSRIQCNSLFNSRRLKEGDI